MIAQNGMIIMFKSWNTELKIYINIFKIIIQIIKKKGKFVYK